MLWIALRLPHLALETLSRGSAPHELAGAPWAIAEDRRVFVCDARAGALGVRPNMGLAAAWALAPALQLRERNLRAEQDALEGVAAWLCRFTPAVSLEPPQGVLAEVGGSLRRFGGLRALAAASARIWRLRPRRAGRGCSRSLRRSRCSRISLRSVARWSACRSEFSA
jgi:protein ImuB